MRYSVVDIVAGNPHLGIFRWLDNIKPLCEVYACYVKPNIDFSGRHALLMKSWCQKTSEPVEVCIYISCQKPRHHPYVLPEFLYRTMESGIAPLSAADFVSIFGMSRDGRRWTMTEKAPGLHSAPRFLGNTRAL
jgi:hypothetical protein